MKQILHDRFPHILEDIITNLSAVDKIKFCCCVAPVTMEYLSLPSSKDEDSLTLKEFSKLYRECRAENKKICFQPEVLKFLRFDFRDALEAYNESWFNDEDLATNILPKLNRKVVIDEYLYPFDFEWNDIEDVLALMKDITLVIISGDGRLEPPSFATKGSKQVTCLAVDSTQHFEDKKEMMEVFPNLVFMYESYRIRGFNFENYNYYIFTWLTHHETSMDDTRIILDNFWEVFENSRIFWYGGCQTISRLQKWETSLVSLKRGPLPSLLKDEQIDECYCDEYVRCIDGVYEISVCDRACSICFDSFLVQFLSPKRRELTT